MESIDIQFETLPFIQDNYRIVAVFFCVLQLNIEYFGISYLGEMKKQIRSRFLLIETLIQTKQN